MSETPQDLREIIAEVIRTIRAEEPPVLEKYVPAFANSFDPPLSPMTVHRWKAQGLIPPPSCNVSGIPYIKRSERLAALEKLLDRRDMKPSINPAAKKAGGA